MAKKKRKKPGIEFREMRQLEEWYNKFDVNVFLRENTKFTERVRLFDEEEKEEFSIIFPDSKLTRAAILELSDEFEFTEDISNNKILFVDKTDMEHAKEKLDMAGIKIVSENYEVDIPGDKKQDFIDDVSLPDLDSDLIDRSNDLHGSMTQPFRPDAAGDISQELDRMRKLAGVGINNPMY